MNLIEAFIHHVRSPSVVNALPEAGCQNYSAEASWLVPN